MKAKRFNEDKPKLGYFLRSFPKALEGIARVKEFGANKYDDGNWRLGNKPDDEYVDSGTRHLVAFLNGETYDQDSGCHHVAHAIWNLCALLELNYQDAPMIDEELFHERMKYWADMKKEPKAPCAPKGPCAPEGPCASPKAPCAPAFMRPIND